jgi:hypothetical protein
VARKQRRDERQEAAQVGREVDVHVTDDPRPARAPGGAQRAPTALALLAQVFDAGQRAGEPGRERGRGVRAGVVRHDDAPRERELGAQEAVQPAQARLEGHRLVVHGHDDVDLGRRRREVRGSEGGG